MQPGDPRADPAVVDLIELAGLWVAAEDWPALIRTLRRLDDELSRTFYVPIERAKARRILTAIEALGQQQTSVSPEFEALREAIKVAMVDENEGAEI